MNKGELPSSFFFFNESDDSNQINFSICWLMLLVLMGFYIYVYLGS